MQRTRTYLVTALWISLLLWQIAIPVNAQGVDKLGACDELAFSTEEDFVTQGPLPPDGNPIISDGDLLGGFGDVCLRNHELLTQWDVRYDLGLDAADVIDVDGYLVAFSTELADPGGNFGSGDLLVTNGLVIPNQALMLLFQVSYDVGLDAIHFTGKHDHIRRFLTVAIKHPRDEWLDSGLLQEYLQEYDIDIWFSTEGTEQVATATPFLDGDLLFARHGIKVLSQEMILPAAVPAGIVKRGVDFGLDAVTSTRTPDRPSVRFSTEILYRGVSAFTDGDVLRAVTGAVEIHHPDLTAPFEPYARFLGVDALYMYLPDIDASDGTTDTPVDQPSDDPTSEPANGPDDGSDGEGQSGGKGGSGNDGNSDDPSQTFLPLVQNPNDAQAAATGE